MAVITEKAEFLAFMEEEALPLAAAAMVDPARNADQKLSACYYDTLRAAIKLKKQGLIDPDLCDEIIANFRTTYRDTYLVTSSYNPSVAFLYTTGLAEDFLENGDVTSKAAIAQICTNSGFIISPVTTAKYTEIHYARELAFAMSALLNNFRVGNVDLEDIETQVTEFKDNAITLLENWQASVATITQFYIRPFMVALLTDALILYDTTIGLSTAEKDEIRDCWEYIHVNLWRSGDAHPSLKFTSVPIENMDPNVPDTEEQEVLVAQNQDPENQDGPGTDVSLMHVAAYAWLYKSGYDGDVWAERADEAFIEGYPHYTGGLQQYGAYIGNLNLAGINAKHVNQQIWTIAEFISYMESVVDNSIDEPAVSSIPYFLGSSGFFGSTISEPPVEEYNPETYFTGGTLRFWYDFTDNTKTLDIGGLPADNGEAVSTVNPTSGATTLTQAGASRPLVAAANVNGLQGLIFDGSKSFNVTAAGGILNNASSVLQIVVGRLKGVGGNAQFFNCVDSGWNTSRWRPFFAANNPGIGAARTSVPAEITSSGVLLGDELIFAVAYYWDVAGATATIKSNNANTDILNDAFGTAGNIENVNSNAGAPITMGANFDGVLFDTALFVNITPTDDMFNDWFAAVKEKFVDTIY